MLPRTQQVTPIFGLSETIQCHLHQIDMNSDQIPKVFSEKLFINHQKYLLNK